MKQTDCQNIPIHQIVARDHEWGQIGDEIGKFRIRNRSRRVSVGPTRNRSFGGQRQKNPETRSRLSNTGSSNRS